MRGDRTKPLAAVIADEQILQIANLIGEFANSLVQLACVHSVERI